MTIEELQKGESENIEFKETKPEDNIKYIKTVVAFANGKGGKIVFGIEDKTLIVKGIDNDIAFKMMDSITDSIINSCEPLIIPDVTLQSIDGKTVIIVEISPGRQRPYYIKSKDIFEGTFIRIAGTTRHADRETITELYYEGTGKSFDSVVEKNSILNETEINNICKLLRNEAQRNITDNVQKSKVKKVTKNKLVEWGIIAEEADGIHPTNAYNFLLGKEKYSSMIQCAVFKGNKRGIFIDKREYEGKLWEQVEDAFEFVLRNIHLGAKVEGIYRQDRYEIPPESIRELLVNAVVHCSYIKNEKIQVAVFDDRLEITSPGGLLPDVTIAKMKEGYSKIRNHAIANAFAYMNIIEGWGSGIPKIIEEVIGYGLREPEFIDLETALRVNIYRSNAESAESGSTALKSSSTAQNSGSIAEKTEDENSKIEHNIRESLLSKGLTEKYIDNILIVYSSVNNQVFKQSDIMRILKCSKTKAGYLISNMKKAEIIVSVQAGVYGGYRFAI